MLFVAICLDKPDMHETRAATRPARDAWLKGHGEALKLTGPFLDSTGQKPVGSLLIVEAADLDAAKTMLAGDPYEEVGMFASIDVKPWRVGIGKLG